MAGGQAGRQSGRADVQTGRQAVTQAQTGKQTGWLEALGGTPDRQTHTGSHATPLQDHQGQGL